MIIESIRNGLLRHRSIGRHGIATQIIAEDNFHLHSGGKGGIEKKYIFIVSSDPLCTEILVSIFSPVVKHIAVVGCSCSRISEAQYFDCRLGNTKEMIDFMKIVFNKDDCPDILITVGGFYECFGNDTKMIEQESWKSASENVKACFFACQTYVNTLNMLHRHGKIINITGPCAGGYSRAAIEISNYGISGLTKGLGMTFAKQGIFVNGIEASTPEDIRQASGIILYMAGDNANQIVGEIVKLKNDRMGMP